MGGVHCSVGKLISATSNLNFLVYSSLQLSLFII